MKKAAPCGAAKKVIGAWLNASLLLVQLHALGTAKCYEDFHFASTLVNPFKETAPWFFEAPFFLPRAGFAGCPVEGRSAG